MEEGFSLEVAGVQNVIKCRLGGSPPTNGFSKPLFPSPHTQRFSFPSGGAPALGTVVLSRPHQAASLILLLQGCSCDWSCWERLSCMLMEE